MMSKESTKSLIISLLGKEFPLTLNQIYKEIQKINAVSYQAIHKETKKLVDQQIVNKIDKQYLLNKEWVQDQVNDYSNFYANYFHLNFNPRQIDRFSKIQTFRFNSLKEMVDFLIETYLNGDFGDNKKEICVSARILMPYIPHMALPFIKKLTKENDLYVVSKTNTLADKWTAKFYDSFGAKVKIGVKIQHYDTVCIGDCVLQYFFFFSDEYRSKFHKFGETINKISKINLLKKTSDIFNKKTEIYLVINRQKLFAENVRNSILKEFK